MGTVTGDAPQPGETPRTEADPWLFDPDAAYWRGHGDRERADALAEAAARPRGTRYGRAAAGGRSEPVVIEPLPGDPGFTESAAIEPAFAEEAFDAHGAGVHDAGHALRPEPPPAVRVEAEQAGRIESAEDRAAAGLHPEPVERDHDRRTRDRFLMPGAEEHQPDEPGPHPEPPDLACRPDGVPEVMVLPEPEHNRPTVPLEREALDRGYLDRGYLDRGYPDRGSADRGRPVPDQQSALARRTDRLGQSRMSAAELNLKRSRVENSPFWLDEADRAAAGNAWPSPDVRNELADAPADESRGRAPKHRPRNPHPAAPGLFGLIALGLIAAFFSWVSAEPFWLAAGHGDRGVATVARCTGTGVTQRCAGSFAADDGSYSAGRVALLGVPEQSTDPGAVVPARMVDPTSRQAYVGSTGTLLQLRWMLGFLLVLLCGLSIAGLTGTRQLESVRARRTALAMSVAGPLLLLAGFLFATY